VPEQWMWPSRAVVESALAGKDGEVAVVEMREKARPEDSIRHGPRAVVDPSPTGRPVRHVTVCRCRKVRAGSQNMAAGPLD